MPLPQSQPQPHSPRGEVSGDGARGSEVSGDGAARGKLAADPAQREHPARHENPTQREHPARHGNPTHRAHASDSAKHSDRNANPGRRNRGKPPATKNAKTTGTVQPRQKKRENHRQGPRPFSPAQLAQRAALLPAITFPDQLPVSARRDEIAAAIRDHQVTIVCGETGSGKTTQIPKICLQLGRGIGAMIGHTQPRRLAARAVADRIAFELGSKVSSAADSIVGYQVRFTDEVGPSTLIKLMTDGILLAEIQTDPMLRRYDTIIIDEAHERSLNIDFLLGYLKQLLPRRPDLKLIITSATIDSDRFAQHFSDEDGRPAPVIEVSGRTYPVEIRYRPLSAEDRDEDGHAATSLPTAPTALGNEDDVNSDNSALAITLEDADSELATLGYGRGEDIDYFTAICHATDELCEEGPGDILVFLPGERDIRDTTEALRDHLGARYIAAGQAHEKSALDGIEVVPLYSRLSAPEQQRIFEDHPRRRVVLATNVAETSLTVPGIRYVIDPGLARISRYSNRTKVQRLPIEPVSQASANQRSGRCGRVDDGVAIRLYSQSDFIHRPEYTEPEILRTSLASVILQMISLGLGQVEDFPFLDAPAAAAVRQGIDVLDEIGAIAPRNDSTKGTSSRGRREALHKGTSSRGHSKADRTTAQAPLRLTRIGRDLARLPIDPRLGRMLIEASRNGCASEVIIIVAALSMQDVRERPEAFQGDADAAHARFLDPTSDFITYLSIWRYLRLVSREMSNSAMRRLCKREFLHYLRWREWQDVAQQLTELSKPLRLQVRPLELPTRADVAFQERTAGIEGAMARAAVDTTRRTSGANADAIHQSLLVGLLSNLGWWDQQRQVYEGARAAKFVIWPGSGLARKHYDWVMAAELVETSRLFARTVAKIDPAWVEPLAKRFVKRSYSEPYWSTRQGAAMVREKVTLYGLTLIADRPVLLANLPADVPVLGVGAAATSVAARALPGASQTAAIGGGLPDAQASAAELARDLFIRHALIEEQWDANYPFISKNRNVLADIRESEQKLRTGGAVSEDALFGFYDERLPDSVVSQRSFDQWWRRTKHRDALLLSREALLPDAQAWDPRGFPSRWEQADVSLPLEYEFTPGSTRDGLNVRVPISVLARVRDRGFEWLVPGMLEELVTATIRALPKQLRAQLVPAPQVGAELAAWIREHVWGQDPMVEDVSGVGRSSAGAGGAGANGSSADGVGASADSADSAAHPGSGTSSAPSISGTSLTPPTSGTSPVPPTSGTSSPHKTPSQEPKPRRGRACGVGANQPGSTGRAAANQPASSAEVDPRSLEASLGRLAAWAQKSGAASARSVEKMRAAAAKPATNNAAPTPPTASHPTSGEPTSAPPTSDTSTPHETPSQTTKPHRGRACAQDQETAATALANPGQTPRKPRLPGTASGADLPHFFDAFRDASRVLRGVDVPQDLWDDLELASHATATFIVVDERGRELRSGPSLTFLQKQLSSQAQLAVRSAMREALEQAMREQGEASGKPRKGDKRSRGLKAFAGVEPGADLRGANTVGDVPEESGGADSTAPDGNTPTDNPRGSKPTGTTPGTPAARPPQGTTREATARTAPPATGQSSPTSSPSLEQNHLTDWPTNNGQPLKLPRQLETTTRAGLLVRGYPALTPQGSYQAPAAGVRVFPTSSEATLVHPQGLARLLVNRVGLSQSRVATRWTGREALTLASGPYPNTAELVAQAQYASALSLLSEFTPDPISVRTQEDFTQLVTWVRERHEDRVYQIVGYAVDIFSASADLDRAIRAHSVPSLLRVLQDVRAHSAALLTDSLLADVPLVWLAHVARFLRADALRVQKVASSANALSRDEGLRREVASLEQLIHDEDVALLPDDEDGRQRLQQARWLMEELRVSLFAQELGTSQKVSVKRIRNLVSN